MPYIAKDTHRFVELLLGKVEGDRLLGSTLHAAVLVVEVDVLLFFEAASYEQGGLVEREVRGCAKADVTIAGAKTFQRNDTLSDAFAVAAAVADGDAQKGEFEEVDAEAKVLLPDWIHRVPLHRLRLLFRAVRHDPDDLHFDVRTRRVLTRTHVLTRHYLHWNITYIPLYSFNDQ